MRDEMRIFKNWTLLRNLSCFSTKIGEKSEFVFKDLTILLQKMKEQPPLHEKLVQPLFLIEIFISDMIG